MASDDDALNWPGDTEGRVSGQASSKPGAKKPAAKKPAAKKPAAKKPAATEPAAKKSATEQPAAEKPAEPERLAHDEPEPTFDELMDPGPRPQLPASALVVFGLFAGLYLLFSVGWLVIALNPPVNIADPIGSFMWMASLWFATFGGLIWFSATLALGASRSVSWRIFMMFLGALVLIPWPYFALVWS